MLQPLLAQFQPLLAHIAGIPVEETLLSFGPVVAVAGGAASIWLRGRIADVRQRARGEAEGD